MRRTSVMLPDEVFDELSRVAEAEGKRLSEVVREAAQDFIAGKGKSSRSLSFAGKGASGTGDVSIRAEEYLASGFGTKKIKGRSSRR